MKPSTRLETHWETYRRRHLGDGPEVESCRQAFYSGAQAMQVTLLHEIGKLPDFAGERELWAIEAEIACFQKSLEEKPCEQPRPGEDAGLVRLADQD